MDAHPVLGLAKYRVLTVTVHGSGIYCSIHILIGRRFVLAQRLAINLFGVRVAQPVAHQVEDVDGGFG